MGFDLDWHTSKHPPIYMFPSFTTHLSPCLSCRLCASLCFTFLYLSLSFCPTCPSINSVSHNRSYSQCHFLCIIAWTASRICNNCKCLHRYTCEVVRCSHHRDVYIGIRTSQNQRDTFPSIKRLNLDMKLEPGPAVKKTLGHASVLLSLAVHWELIGVTTP